MTELSIHVRCLCVIYIDTELPHDAKECKWSQMHQKVDNKGNINSNLLHNAQVNSQVDSLLNSDGPSGSQRMTDEL